MVVRSTLIKPGQVNNPNGRPVSEASRLRSEMRDAFCLKTYPKFDEFVQEIHKLALGKGKEQINAIRIILDYCLGKPAQMKEEDAEGNLNAREMITLKILFDLISPYMPSDKMNEIRDKFSSIILNDSSSEN